MQNINEIKTTQYHSANNSTLSINWKDVIIGGKGEGIQTIEYLAKRRFKREPLAQESVNYVLEKISDNDWQLCSNFQGKANAKTFARRIIINLLEEFSRKRFGRPRPPSWLKRRGEIWVKIWKELYLERQLLPSIIDRHSDQGEYDREWLEGVAATIKAKIPNCGHTNLEALCIEDIVSASNQAIIEERQNPLQQTTTNQTQKECKYSFEYSAQTKIILTLQAIIQEPLYCTLFESASTATLENQANKHETKLEQLSQKIQLSDEEVILLRMIYRDGLSRTTVAKALGLSNYLINSQLQSTLTRIRSAIEECGLDLESLLPIVSH